MSMSSWFDKGLARARPVGRRRDDSTGTITEASLAEQRDFRGALTEDEGKTTIALRGALSGKSPAAINKMLNTFSDAMDHGGYTGTRINPRSFSAGSSAWAGRVAPDRASPNSFSNQPLWYNPSAIGPKPTGRASFGSRSYGDGSYSWSYDQQKLDEADPRFKGSAGNGLKPAVPPVNTTAPSKGGQPGAAQPEVGYDPSLTGDDATSAGTVFTAAAAMGAGNKSMVAAGVNANASVTAGTGRQVPFLMSTDPFGTQIRPGASNSPGLTEIGRGVSYIRPPGAPALPGAPKKYSPAVREPMWDLFTGERMS